MSNSNNNRTDTSYTLPQYVYRRKILGVLLNEIDSLNNDIINMILNFAMVPIITCCTINDVNQQFAIISIKELSNKIFLDNIDTRYYFGDVERYYSWFLVYNSKLKKIQ